MTDSVSFLLEQARTESDSEHEAFTAAIEFVDAVYNQVKFVQRQDAAYAAAKALLDYALQKPEVRQ